MYAPTPVQKFDSQVNFTNMLMNRISEIQTNMRHGSDCTLELKNFIILLPAWFKNPINDQINKTLAKYSLMAEVAYNNPQFPETSYAWSKRHRIAYRNETIKRIQTEAILSVLSIIINHLDKVGLLIERSATSKI